jgi:predicted kinase
MITNRTPALVLLCGASFSGKSSRGQVLADGLGAQIVSLDAINGERGLWGGQGIPVSEWALTNAEAHQRVDKLLNRGEWVIVDDQLAPFPPRSMEGYRQGQCICLSSRLSPQL